MSTTRDDLTTVPLPPHTQPCASKNWEGWLVRAITMLSPLAAGIWWIHKTGHMFAQINRFLSNTNK